MEGILDHIGADGVVGTGFAGAVKTALAAEATAAGDADLAAHYGASKYLDDVTSLTGLVKRGMDTRRDNTRLTEAAKNTIPRPAEGATDDEKAEFKKLLRTEIGASGNVDDYKVPRPENLPEGLPWNQEGADAWARYFCDRKVSVEDARDITQALQKEAISAFNASKEDDARAGTEAFDAGVKTLTDTKSGPELIEMGTLARKAIEGYGLPGKDADHCKAVAAATAAAPSDLAIWRAQGVSPTSFAWLAAIGNDMAAGTSKLGDGGAGKGEDTEKQVANKVNALTPEFQQK